MNIHRIYHYGREQLLGSSPSEIDARSTSSELVSPSGTRLRNNGASVYIRGRGCFVTRCRLVPEGGRDAVDVLYSPPLRTIGKLAATHVMSPVGKANVPGGQHGRWRWEDYRRSSQAEGRPHVAVFESGQDSAGLEVLRRSVDLSNHNELVITNTLQSHDDIETHATSLGEHLYLPCDEAEIPKIAINGEMIGSVLPDGVLADILEGKPYEWREAPSELVLGFADGRNISVASEASISNDVGDSVPQVISYLLWHRKGTDTICFEPVVGYLNGENTNLHLPPRGTATLRTVIRLV